MLLADIDHFYLVGLASDVDSLSKNDGVGSPVSGTMVPYKPFMR